MIDRVCLDWLVPVREWDAFCEHVMSEFGDINGYAGREAGLAMREYLDADGYADVEETVDQLVRAAGRTPSATAKKKKSSSLAEQDTTRVQVRIDAQIKDKFRSLVDRSETDDSYGVAFALALRSYREGGRAARLERKLDRVVDDAAAILAELDDGEGADDGLSTVERRTIIICNRLPDDEFTDDELRQEIADVAGSSDPTIDRYRERVIDRLNYEPHPNAPRRIWISAQRAAEIAGDVPPEVRRPVDMLDRKERVRRIKLALGRRATKRNGRIKVHATEIRDSVFDADIALPTVRDLLNQVALDDGFRLNRSGSNMTIGAHVGQLSDESLATDMRAYVEADCDGLLGETTETTVQQWTTEPSAQPASDAETGASGAATDGGGPSPQDGDRDE